MPGESQQLPTTGTADPSVFTSERIAAAANSERDYTDGAVKALQTQLDDMRSMLQERYETQTKAVDAAFLANQTAMQAALTAAERAVQTALLSAEKAVVKAELAADKRFEAVNEFRAQLADQASTFISRTEADARIIAIAEKLETEAKRLTERSRENADRMGAIEGRITSRLDLRDGAIAGGREKTEGVTTQVGLMIAGSGLLISIVIVIANLLTSP